MKKFIVSALIITLGFLLKHCNTTDPPPPPNGEKPTLELTLEGVSCIEAWIKLTTTNFQLPTTIQLKQDSTVTQELVLSNADTLLYIDSLLPNKTYQYQVFSIEHQISSNEINITTMDTTSHDFTFQAWIFGTVGSSRLYDVAIINENNIWAVGEIMIADTSQNGYTTYNAVHWNGLEWKLHRIMFYTICGQQHQNAYAASSIFAFSDNDIWVGMQGSQIARLNDTTQISTQCIPISVRKLWGTDSQNLYAVGVNGQIAHYNGTLWTRIESETNLNIGDIWGIADASSRYNKYLVTENALLKLDIDNQLNSINVEPGMFLNSVWGITDELIYTAGAGVVLYKNFNWEKINRPDVNSIYVIKGQNYNDIYGISAAYTILHFNGYNWANVNSFPNDTYYSMNVLNNLAAVAGWQGDRAVITVIRRNH